MIWLCLNVWSACIVCLQVPDVDFLVHLGDGCPAGLPLVQSNINRSNEHAGFTIPMYMWKQALGPEQFAVLAECLQVSVREGRPAGWQQPWAFST